jgi:hypothetical protein
MKLKELRELTSTLPEDLIVQFMDVGYSRRYLVNGFTAGKNGKLVLQNSFGRFVDPDIVVHGLSRRPFYCWDATLDRRQGMTVRAVSPEDAGDRYAASLVDSRPRLVWASDESDASNPTKPTHLVRTSPGVTPHCVDPDGEPV